ncbi:hypothetical protein MJ257_18525, partial [Paenibacillus timonensis]
NVVKSTTFSGISTPKRLKCCKKCNISAANRRFEPKMLYKMQHFRLNPPNEPKNVVQSATFCPFDDWGENAR